MDSVLGDCLKLVVTPMIHSEDDIARVNRIVTSHMKLSSSRIRTNYTKVTYV